MNKYIKTIVMLTGSLFLITACNSKTENNTVETTKNQEGMATTDNNTPLFPKGERLSNEWFNGNAYLHPMLNRDKNNDFSLGNVTFELGARTHWHTHPKGQVLIVTEGMGWYQEKGKPAQVIKKGDVINIPENVEHWHGAAAKSEMAHIALTNFEDDTNVIWLAPVTDEEYNEVNK